MLLLKSIIKRLASSLVVLLGLTIVIFTLMKAVPGDPARLALGPNVSEEVIEQYRKVNHLDKPIPVQYIYWLTNAIKGDFGISSYTQRAVSQDIKDFAPATIELVIWAGIPPLFFALLLGVISAQHKNKWPDYLTRFLGYIFVATPTFVIAVLFVLIFGYWLPVMPTIGGRLSPQFSITPVTGMYVLDALIGGQFAAAWNAFLHLLFPALALSLGKTMQEARITRASMLQNADKDYITMVTSQGVPKKIINRKFLLKPSVIPTITVMGMDFAALFGNAFLVERIFNWPGLSSYGMNAILNKDSNAVTAVVLIIGLAFVGTSILVDIVAMILDPRMRQARTR
ncbi:MAG TPA: ABC transporter permease [Clostridiaceae bacterium]|nr:ABC transporter permease [Clostridiaceae bacterium]